MQNINACQFVLEASDYHVVISQRCNFKVVNFMYYRISYFNHSSEGDEMLRLACWTCIPLF